jgi:RNA polymerase-binding transcription factor DksA
MGRTMERPVMNKTGLETYRRKLQQWLARMQPVAKAVSEQTRSASTGQGTNELSNTPLHLGDGGTEEYLHDLNATLLENEAFLLCEVRAALTRIDDGTYGTCESCGGTVARARLDALPYTRYCVECSATQQDVPQANYETGRTRSTSEALADRDEMQIRKPR